MTINLVFKRAVTRIRITATDSCHKTIELLKTMIDILEVGQDLPTSTVRQAKITNRKSPFCRDKNKRSYIFGEKVPDSGKRTELTISYNGTHKVCYN